MNDHHHEVKILHNSRHGFMVYCPGCGRFQLGFGTFRLCQARGELDSFAQLINRYNHKHDQRTDRSRRDVFIESPYPGFGLLLSPEDLSRLNHLLQSSLLILEATNNQARLQ